MRYLLIIIVFISLFNTTSLYAEVKTEKQDDIITLENKSEFEKDFNQIIQTIRTIINGARFESPDNKNASFTIKPNRASLKIEF